MTLVIHLLANYCYSWLISSLSPTFPTQKKEKILIHPTPSPPPNGEGLCQVKIHPKQDNRVMMRMRMMRMRKKEHRWWMRRSKWLVPTKKKKRKKKKKKKRTHEVDQSDIATHGWISSIIQTIWVFSKLVSVLCVCFCSCCCGKFCCCMLSHDCCPWWVVELPPLLASSSFSSSSSSCLL